MMWESWRRGDYEVSTDPDRIDSPLVARFLSEEAYWSPGVPLDVVRRAFANSLVFRSTREILERLRAKPYIERLNAAASKSDGLVRPARSKAEVSAAS